MTSKEFGRQTRGLFQGHMSN